MKTIKRVTLKHVTKLSHEEMKLIFGGSAAMPDPDPNPDEDPCAGINSYISCRDAADNIIDQGDAVGCDSGTIRTFCSGVAHHAICTCVSHETSFNL